ncbi:MAG: hypothetical protein AAF530_04810 [Pseudomonadota bacterium]
MAATVSVHKISRYKVQVITKVHGQSPRPSVTVRLYSDGDEMVGTVVFKDYGANSAELPQGDFDKKSATAYFDIAFCDAFLGILRHEEELYWKIAWRQLGAVKTCSDVSLDTKSEIIGEFFSRDD